MAQGDFKFKLPEEMLHEMGALGGYAHGSYITKCNDCGTNFIGDKRAFQCLPCAAKKLRDQQEGD